MLCAVKVKSCKFLPVSGIFRCSLCVHTVTVALSVVFSDVLCVHTVTVALSVVFSDVLYVSTLSVLQLKQ